MTKDEMKMTFTQTITREEMKNRISMALKDPILQQGFEIICKENAELEQKLEQTEKDLADYQFNYPSIKELSKENAELKKKLKEKLKTIADKDLSFVAKFDALKSENAELKEKLEKETNHRIQNFNKAIEWKEKHRELKQENAEFKDALKGKRCNCMTYLNFKDLEKELTKAEEIIRTLLLVADNKVSQMEFQLCVADAKQFLKENGGEK